MPQHLKELGKVSNYKKQITLLLAEDSPEYQAFMKLAFQKSHFSWCPHIVNDGEELLDYLYHRHQYSEKASAPRPHLILLDLYLPKIDGKQAIQIIKADPNLKRIPIVMLTASTVEEDIRCSYELGASSYLAKPMTFKLLVEAVNTLGEYWFDIVELPPANNS